MKIVLQFHCRFCNILRNDNMVLVFNIAELTCSFSFAKELSNCEKTCESFTTSSVFFSFGNKWVLKSCNKLDAKYN